MINMPFSDSFKTDDVDLNQLYEALTENSNYHYFDGELCAPSPTLVRLQNVMAERKGTGHSLVIDPSDGPLFMEYFAIRFRFVYDNEMAFLEWHKQHTFNSDAKAFVIFLKSAIRKYERLFPVGKEHHLAISKSLNGLRQPEEQIGEVPNKTTAGRPPSEKIEIVKPPSRSSGDKMTILDLKSTAELFTNLAVLGCILGEGRISKANMAKGIQALTGFSDIQIEGLLTFEKKKSQPQNFYEEKEKLENIKNLIIKELKKKMGSY